MRYINTIKMACKMLLLVNFSLCCNFSFIFVALK